MNRIIGYIDKLKKIDLPSLERKNKDYEFTQVYPQLERMYEYYTKLENEHDFFNPLPEHNKQQILQHLSEFTKIAEEISSFDPQKHDALAKKEQLFRRTTDSYQNSYNFIRDFDIYLSKKQSEVAERTLELLREASVETGISRFAGFFKKIVGTGIFGKQASKNIFIALFFLVIGIGIACFIYKDLQLLLDKLTDMIEKKSDVKISFQVILIRIVIISFVTFIFYQVIRIFNVNMHLYTMNKHRENILHTYRLLIEGVENKDSKKEILMQAVRTIFEHGDTGYLSKKDSQIPIIEFMKMIEKADKT
ncbi:MAG: hypothetical protein JW984_02215 [Deltaproteobacteria bacterium]|uniref:DUF6161 domain-containing protein n=1 Tax=Candidatus Zymogenus saltonus TaxID=2844893 RepID=A0A9D8KE59_9DELT|nr:hypothetical protein [Candidatus Zymogenus saltonus]